MYHWRKTVENSLERLKKMEIYEKKKKNSLNGKKRLKMVTNFEKQW